MIIPEGVKSILSQTFSACNDITSIIIPNSVTDIGSEAFWGCTNLAVVSVGSGLANIDSGAFFGCTSLTDISISAANPYLCSINGVVYNKAQDTLIVCPAGKTGSYTIPFGVTKIENSAFSTSNLDTVILPNTVTCIGLQAFAFMPQLSDKK